MKHSAGLLLVTGVWLAAATGAVAAFLADKLLHAPLPAKRLGGFDDDGIRDAVVDFVSPTFSPMPSINRTTTSWPGS